MILRGPRVHCHFPAGTPSLRPPRAHRTLLRRGEALALRWPDVDLERGRSGSGEPCSSTAACSSPSPRRRSRSGSCRSPYRPSGSCATYATPGPGAPGRRLVLAGERPRVHHRVRRTLRRAQRPAGPRGSGRQGRAPDVGLHTLPALGGQRDAHAWRPAQGGLRDPRPPIGRDHRTPTSTWRPTQPVGTEGLGREIGRAAEDGGPLGAGLDVQRQWEPAFR
jgi:hypothetical protein